MHVSSKPILPAVTLAAIAIDMFLLFSVFVLFETVQSKKDILSLMLAGGAVT